MLFYHYSVNNFKQLKSKRLQKSPTKKELKEYERIKKFRSDVGLYVDSISLFIDPVPIKIIGKLFNNKHPLWYDGNVIYQHVVDSKDIEKNINYFLTDTPVSDSFLKSKGWSDDNDWKKTFFLEKRKYLEDLKYIGFNKVDLLKRAKLYKGNTEEFFKLAAMGDDFENNKTKYASNVPHLMIYPTEGTLDIKSVKSLVIGKVDIKDPKLSSIMPGILLAPAAT